VKCDTCGKETGLHNQPNGGYPIPSDWDDETIILALAHGGRYIVSREGITYEPNDSHDLCPRCGKYMSVDIWNVSADYPKCYCKPETDNES